MPPPPIKRPLVKFIMPSIGLFAFYLGALAGVFLCSRAKGGISGFTQTLAAGVLGTLLAFGAMTAADSRIGLEADHVDILKTLLYLCLAALAVMAERLIGERLGHAVPQFLENLAIWGAGVASIWQEEPDFPGWNATAIKILRRR